MGRWVLSSLAVAAASCGRLNFEEAGPRIQLSVVTNSPAGVDSPLVAFVLLDTTLTQTDNDGRLSIPAPGPRTFHVIHEIATGWRVTTLVDIAPDTSVNLGSRSLGDRATFEVVVDFPMLAGSLGYELAVSTRCLAQGDHVAAIARPFTFRIAEECRGEQLTGHALGFSVGGAPIGVATVEFIAEPGIATPIEAWTNPPSAMAIEVRRVPATTTEMYVSGVAILGDDVLSARQIRVDPPYSDPTVVAATMRVSPTGLGVFAIDEGAAATSSYVGPGLVLDGDDLLPYAASVLAIGDRTIAWETVVDADVQRIEVLPSTATGTEWIAYAPPAFGQLAFPTLPAELADADPGVDPPWTAVTQAVDVIGLDRAEVLEVLDREWTFWNVWDARLPAGGFRVSGVSSAVLP